MKYLRYFWILFKFIGKKSKLSIIENISFGLIASASEAFALTYFGTYLSQNTSDIQETRNDFIANITKGKSQEEVLVTLLITLCIAGILKVIAIYSSKRMIATVGIEVSNKVYEGYIVKDFQSIKEVESKDIITDLTVNVGSLVNAYTAVVSIALTLCSISGLVIALSIINPQIIWSLLVLIVVIYYCISRTMKNYLTKTSSLLIENRRNIVGLLQRSFNEIADIKIRNKEKELKDKHLKMESLMRYRKANADTMSEAPKTVVEYIVILGIFLAAAIQKEGSLSDRVATLTPILIGIGKIAPLIQELFRNWSVVVIGRSQIRKSISILEKRSKDICRVDDQVRTKGRRYEFKPESINIDQMTFRTNSITLHEDISRSIELKGLTMISGRSGSGKSTLMEIMVGLIEPSEGNIWVLGKNKKIKALEREWQEKIVYIPQKTYKPKSTLIEYLGAGKMPYKEIKKAFKCTGIDKFINEDRIACTVIEEDGRNFSGGQMQRLCIARALLRNSKVQFWDEATCSIDKKSEFEIMKNIKAMYPEKAIIFISHNKGLEKIADRVINLGD